MRLSSGSRTVRRRRIAAGRVRRWAAVAISSFALGACDSPAPTEVPRETRSDTQSVKAAAEPEWDRVLENVTLEGDVVVPAGERWLIGPNVRIAGNLRTDSGTIAMRPGSSLHFIGADPNKYVGGGMAYEARFVNDIGLWIGRYGVLDIRGTPKASWNRTGTDPTWEPDDEYYIAPTEPGDYAPKPWKPGDPIPQIDPRVPPAEVLNVTRDVLIEGPGHIHIHSVKPQRIEYVTLKNMGVSNKASRGPVTGRYALHFHHAGGEGESIVRGVAAVNSRGRVFVPHMSKGITFEDVVSVNSWGDGFWWDLGDRSKDIHVDHMAVVGVNMPRKSSGATSQYSAIVLGGGDNISIRNSVAAGSRGTKISHGFDWPSKADNKGAAVWDFSEGNVAHNNEGSGIRFWFNNADNHIVENAITYRNGTAGVENGAYRNAHRYIDVLMVEDKLVEHASSLPHRLDGKGARFEKMTVVSPKGPALSIGRLRLPPMVPTEFVDCDFETRDGSPKVQLDTRQAENPFIAVFRNCDLTPDDIKISAPFAKGLKGTNIRIENADGTAWEITLDMAAGKKVVRELD